MSTCNETLKAQHKTYPRTCEKCGLGPCIEKLRIPPMPPVASPAPELVYAVLWSYADRSAGGAVSVHRTKAGADRMVNLLSKHSETKQFTVEPVPSEP